jgi:hypothetical protein
VNASFGPACDCDPTAGADKIDCITEPFRMLIAGPNPSPASSGQALALVSNATAADLTDELTRLGYRASAVDDPYAAMVELLDRPLVYRALVVSLPPCIARSCRSSARSAPVCPTSTCCWPTPTGGTPPWLRRCGLGRRVC